MNRESEVDMHDRVHSSLRETWRLSPCLVRYPGTHISYDVWVGDVSGPPATTFPREQFHQRKRNPRQQSRPGTSLLGQDMHTRPNTWSRSLE